jgi:hypothetical protein
VAGTAGDSGDREREEITSFFFFFFFESIEVD